MNLGLTEIQKKLNALTLPDHPTNQKPSAQAATTTTTTSNSQNQRSSATTNGNDGNRKALPAPAKSTTTSNEDGIHTSKRTRNLGSQNATTTSTTSATSATTTTNTNTSSVASNQKAIRGIVSNTVTKPNGRGDTLRDAMEAKK